MKKYLLLIITLVAPLLCKAQVNIPYQEISYDVNYHWGLIDVMIARGVVTIQSDGQQFYGTLDGTSIPWEGKIICVSDTLNASVDIDASIWQQTVTYQSGWYRHVPVSVFRGGSYNPDDPAYFRNIAGQGNYDASNNSMEAITVTSDMLGMYYYSHLIDFDALTPGDRVVVQIHGPYSRQLVITYQGQGVYSSNGDNYPTYNCMFEYSYGGSMSGYPVDCKIGATDRIPLFLSASLPVGRVEMLYNP